MSARSIRRPFRPSAFSVALGIAFTASGGTVAAQETEKKDAVQLPQVKVETDAEADAYKADVVSSPKFTQPLVDTPQTITVIKKEVLAEQGAVSLTEALRNTPGITLQLGENGNTQSGDSVFMRGFDTQGAIFVDNVRDIGPAVRDVFNVEQIEVVKGPAGADNGRGTAAGYINLVSKVPFADNAKTATLVYGTESQKRLTADLNQTLGETAALRLNVMAQDGGVPGRDFIERQQWGIAPSLALGLGSGTRFFFYSQHIRQDNIPDGAVPTIGLDGYKHGTDAAESAPKVDVENFYGFDDDFEDITANMFTSRIEHDLKGGVTIRNLTRYGKADQERVLTAPLQGPVAAPTDAQPEVVTDDPSTWVVARSRHASYRQNQVLTNQTNFTVIGLDTGGIKHDISGGIEFIYESQDSPTYAASGTVPVANLYDPSRLDAAPAMVPMGGFGDGRTVTGGLYLFDTLRIGERWQLSGGLRWERYETTTETGTASTTTPVVVTATRMEDADDLLSWKAGVLYKPTENGSVYVSYANLLRPPGADNFTLTSGVANSSGSVNINSSGLEPQEATNIELGTKWDFLEGRLGATAALFSTSNKNDLARLETDVVRQYGEKNVEGVELALIGNITRAWQLTFGYLFQDTEVSEGVVTSDGQTTSGVEINFSPRNSATLWTTYELPFKLTIGGGARYVDSQARTILTPTTNADAGIFEVASYTVFDLMAAYDITEHFNLQFNAYNVTDEDYVSSVNNSGQRYKPGTPLSYLLTFNVEF